MTKQTAKMSARGSMIAAGAWMLTLAFGVPALAAGVSVDEKIPVPGETPSGVVQVEGHDPIKIPGAKDVTIRIQATVALAEPVVEGASGFGKCRKLDKSIRLHLAADATGAVTVSYTPVDPETGVSGAPVTHSTPFQAAASETSPGIKLCLR